MQSRPDVFGRNSSYYILMRLTGRDLYTLDSEVPNIWPFIWKLYTVLWSMRYAQLKENTSK